MRLLEKLGKTKRSDDCDHANVVETAIHGLERRVCGDCGHVAIAYSEPVVTEARPARHRF